MSAEAMELFEAVRGELFDAIRRSLASDGHCKSYEGALYIAHVWPNYFEHSEPPHYRVHLDCYVIGPNRHYDWTAQTMLGAVAAFAADVRQWIKDYESEDAA